MQSRNHLSGFNITWCWVVSVHTLKLLSTNTQPDVILNKTCDDSQAGLHVIWIFFSSFCQCSLFQMDTANGIENIFIMSDSVKEYDFGEITKLTIISSMSCVTAAAAVSADRVDKQPN